MSKKIIAVALAIVMIAVMFTACSKKLRVEKIEGKEHAVMTDKDGNVVVDASNRVQAIVTDRAGEIVTYEGGEPQTYWVPIQNYFVADGKLYTGMCVLSSVKGWEMAEAGVMEKKDTDGKCTITVSIMIEKDYEDASLEEWLAHNRETEKELAIALKENGYSVEASEEKVTLTDRDINMILRKAVIYNPDGSIANYSESLFFQLGASQKYSIQYKCVDGVGYDESFDFIDFVDNNFKLIK